MAALSPEVVAKIVKKSCGRKTVHGHGILLQFYCLDSKQKPDDCQAVFYDNGKEEFEERSELSRCFIREGKNDFERYY